MAQRNPQGVLMVGAHDWAREIDRALQSEGFAVRLADRNWANSLASRMEGLPTYYGSVLSEYAIDEIDLNEIGGLLALTPNDEANSLAAMKHCAWVLPLSGKVF